LGLRSLDRGEDFTPYINLGKPGAAAFGSTWQNNPLITMSYSGGGTVTVATNPLGPTGLVAHYVPAGILPMTNEFELYILNPLTTQYEGTFHCYLRGRQTAGNAGDIRAQLLTRGGNVDAYTTSDSDAFTRVNPVQLLDLGEVSILPLQLTSDEIVYSYTWVIQLSSSNAAAVADFFDLILIPVDEWTAEIFNNNVQAGLGARRSSLGGRYVDTGAIANQKLSQRALLKVWSTEHVNGSWTIITNGQPMWQSNVAQRLWVLADGFYDTPADFWSSRPEVCNSYRGYSNDQYQSFRGNR